MLGVVVAISSSSWFGIWVGLELNLLSFIPLIILSGGSVRVEAGLKYFLIQACSSLVLLQSRLFLSKMRSLFIGLTVAALLIKVGGAPFHFWFPIVSEGLTWRKVIILFTIQKIAPLTLLSYLCGPDLKNLYLRAIVLSRVVGAVGGFNEIYLRKLLRFSSISHLGWILLGIILCRGVWLVYFIFYVLISIGLMFVLQLYQIFHFSQIFSKGGRLRGINLGFSFISLGGLPPFVGFAPKWLVVQSSITFTYGGLVLLLICTSLVTLFYYLRTRLRVFNLTKTNWDTPLVFKGSKRAENLILLFNRTGLLAVGGVWRSRLLH